MRREQLLNGICEFPQQILNILHAEGPIVDLIMEFWDALWNSFLRDKNISALVWADKFNDETFFAQLLMHLSKANWIHIRVDNNYATIEFNNDKLLKWLTQDEINHMKFGSKTAHYRMRKSKSILSRLVKIGNTRKETGLVREGFMKAGNNPFSYDCEYIKEYVPYIAYNIDKAYNIGVKEITYNEIVHDLAEYYAKVNDEFTLGNNLIDSRGRSIFQCSKRVFNPVSHKDARASLICPSKPLTKEGFDAVYAAIAELNGYRGKNYEDKVQNGIAMYINREMPDINKMHEANDYSDLHVIIWLSRIYDGLDNYDEKIGWNIPIELDALASMLQLTAVLTNDHEYMRRTNMIGTQFNDAWSVPYCSRNHVKKAVTPKLYGSNTEPKELWDRNKLSYSQEQLNKISEEIRTGLYANANSFKDFIIGKVKPKASMEVNIWGQKFTIECNRFKPGRTTEKTYWIFTSAQNLMKKVVHHSGLIPDLDQFKRYFQTLLLHHLDSRIADTICAEMDWVLPNHDAFTVHPNDASKVREIYTRELYKVYKERRKILFNYFTSIGIKDMYPDVGEYEVEGFSPYCLK